MLSLRGARWQLCSTLSEPALVLGKRRLRLAGSPAPVSRAPSTSPAAFGRNSCSSSGLSAGSSLSFDRNCLSRVSRIIIITGNSDNKGENKRSKLLRSCQWLFKAIFNQKEREIFVNERRDDFWESGILRPGWLCSLRCGLGPFLINLLANVKARICLRVMHLLENCNFHPESMNFRYFLWNYCCLAAVILNSVKLRVYGDGIKILLFTLADQDAELLNFMCFGSKGAVSSQ